MPVDFDSVSASETPEVSPEQETLVVTEAEVGSVETVDQWLDRADKERPEETVDPTEPPAPVSEIPAVLSDPPIPPPAQVTEFRTTNFHFKNPA